MSVVRVNGVELYYQLSGSGQPLVLVHGSWGDHHDWDRVVPGFAESFQVLTFDRRGHSRSEQPPGQGSVCEDADDLAALIDQLDFVPAHVAGNSFGASIVLRAAIRRPDIFRSLIAHEPPLFALLTAPEFAPALAEVHRRLDTVIKSLEHGDYQRGARQFMDTIAFGPGAWDEQLTSRMRETFIANAPTWLDEIRDPAALDIDLNALTNFNKPALLTNGSASMPFFGPVVDMIAKHLPRAQRVTIEGADHTPYLSVPARYVEIVTTFLRTEK
jgi:pimeloyl-ACP methyl ester carboxylesterase